MIIQFSQSGSYWMQQYQSAVDEARYQDAMAYVRNAMRTDASFSVWFAYAQLLHQMEQYDMSASVCLRYGNRKMTEEQKTDWCNLMLDNATATSNISAILYYKGQLLDLEDADYGELLTDLVEQLADRFDTQDEEPLRFSSEAHQDRNRVVYDEMVLAYERKDYVSVLSLQEDMHPDYDFYCECLFMVGKSQLALGLTEAGVDTLRKMYTLTDYDARVLYHLLDVPGALSEDEILQCLQCIDNSSKDNLSVAAMCAYRAHLDEQALSLASRALALAPYDPECMFRLAGAHINMGDNAQGKEWIRRAVQLYEEFFPWDLVRVPLPDRVDLTFPSVPAEWQTQLGRRTLQRAQTEGMDVCMLTDEGFRGDVRFLLSSEVADDEMQGRLAELLSNWTGVESNAFANELLLSPTLPRGVRYSMLSKLLRQVGRGRVYVARRYLLDHFNLRVPASFDQFSDKLQQAYVYAYCEMVLAGKHSERKLCRIAQQIFVRPPAFDYSPEMLGFAIVLDGRIIDTAHLHDYLQLRSWDDETFQYHWDAVREAQES